MSDVSIAAAAARVTGSSGQEGSTTVLLRAVLDAFSIVAFGLAIALAILRPFWMDEAFTASMAASPTIERMFRDWVGIDVHPPLYNLLTYGIYHLLGQSEIILRLPSLLCFGLALIVLRFWGRRVVGEDAARIATAVFGTSYFVLSHAWEARSYPMVMLFAACACLSFLRLRDEPDSNHMIKFLAATVLMSLTHYFGALFAGSLFIMLLLRGLGRPPLLRVTLVGGMVYAACVMPFVIWHATSLIHYGTDSPWIPPFPLWYGAMVAALSCWGGVHGPILALPALGAAVVRRGGVDWRNDAALDLLAAVVIGVGIVLLVSLRVPLIITRYFSPFMVASLLGGAMLVGRLGPVLRQMVAIIMCLASMTEAVPALAVLPKPMRALFDLESAPLAWKQATHRIMDMKAHRVLFVYDGPYIPSFNDRNVGLMGGTFFREAGYAADVLGRSSLPNGSLPLEPLPSGAFAMMKIVNDLPGYKLHRDWSDELLKLRRGRCEPLRLDEPQVCFIEAEGSR